MNPRRPIPRPPPRGGGGGGGGGDPFRVFLNEMIGPDAVNHHHHQMNFGGGDQEREARPDPGQFNFARAVEDFNMRQFMRRAGR